MRPPNQARPSRTSEDTATGSGNSRRSTPKSRKIALLPDPNGLSSIRSIATTSPGLAPRTTIGPVIGAKGCPSQAGVNGVGTARMSSTSSKAPRTSILNSSPESTVIVGGVRVLTEKRYSVGFGLIFRPEALQTAGPDSSTSFGNEAILGPTRLIGATTDSPDDLGDQRRPAGDGIAGTAASYHKYPRRP